MNEVQPWNGRLTFFFFFPHPLLTSQPRSTLINAAAGHCARIKGSHGGIVTRMIANLIPYDTTRSNIESFLRNNNSRLLLRFASFAIFHRYLRTRRKKKEQALKLISREEEKHWEKFSDDLSTGQCFRPTFFFSHVDRRGRIR